MEALIRFQALQVSGRITELSLHHALNPRARAVKEQYFIFLFLSTLHHQPLFHTSGEMLPDSPLFFARVHFEGIIQEGVLCIRGCELQENGADDLLY